MLDEVLTNPFYRNMCRQVACHNYKWEDLYQEFRMAIIERVRKLETLTKNEIDVYCYGVIATIWKQKYKPSKAKSPVFDICDGFVDIEDYKNEVLFQNSKDNDLKKELIKHLDKLLKSENAQTRFQGELLRDFINGENRKKISERLGINYRLVHEGIEEAIAKIKSKLNMSNLPVTKTEIHITLRNEGCQASYSGKDKTFYVDKLPVQFIISEVEKSGFKIKQK